MSDPTHVYGQCQFRGGLEKIQRTFEEWGFIGLFIPLDPGVFVLDGPYPPCGEGPSGPVKEEALQDCLNEVSCVVSITQAEVRCYGPDAGQVWDLIYARRRFIRVPLELQPTLEALDNPMVRRHYGVEYDLTTAD
jgi:hypothetical protein